MKTPFKLFGTDELGIGGVSSQEEKNKTVKQAAIIELMVFIDINLCGEKYP